MKYPWQIWTLFLLCLALVLPALGWLTLKALELDDQRSRAEQDLKEAHLDEHEQRQIAEFVANEAEFQEIVASALWRLDWTLTPLVAQEAARPYYVYSSFYATSTGDNQVQRVPSPLLMQPSEFVLLHFQLTPDSQWSSPQQPLDKLSCELAVCNGTSFSNINTSGERLTQLKKDLDRNNLLSKLPKEMLPPIKFNEVALANGNNLSVNWDGNKLSQSKGKSTDLGFPQLDEPQQFEVLQQELKEFQSQRANPRGGNPRSLNPTPQIASRAGPSRSNGPNQPQGTQQAANPNDQEYPLNRRQQLLRGNEWYTRNRAFESFAQNQIVQQRMNNAPGPVTSVVKEGVSRPVWIDNKLILARRVELGDKVVIQGCWLDWPKIKQMLLDEINDVLPEADLKPVAFNEAEGELAADVRPGRMLATLPIQIVVPDALLATSLPASGTPNNSISELSPIQISLLIAWICMILATGAVAILLRGVVALSERRGSFVSAVTHELRTPLTTFRMYAEMLAEGMVPDAKKRQNYMETLRVEADRLSHLVENVLAYARLERGRNGKQRELISIEQIIDKVESRLADRATQAEMTFMVDAEKDVRQAKLTTDSGAVEQILFNLVDNACKYAVASEDRRIHLGIESTPSKIKLSIRDHGPGISQQEAKSLFKPFSKSVQQAAVSAPGVGLGLALCRRLSKALGGQLELDNANDDGSCFTLTLPVK